MVKTRLPLPLFSTLPLKFHCRVSTNVTATIIATAFTTFSVIAMPLPLRCLLFKEFHYPDEKIKLDDTSKRKRVTRHFSAQQQIMKILLTEFRYIFCRKASPKNLSSVQKTSPVQT